MVLNSFSILRMLYRRVKDNEKLLPRLIGEFKDRILPISPITTDTMIFPCGMSRSGTTLLTTILDSHSRTTFGYELIPPPLPSLSIISTCLEDGMVKAEGDFSKCGAQIRKSGEKDIGQWLARCHRAGANADDVRKVLKMARSQGLGSVSTFIESLKLAYLVVKCIQEKSGAEVCGFKFTANFDLGHKTFPNGYFIYILRDPRDVVASQKKRGFNRSVREICWDWNHYTNNFLKFHSKHPDISQVIRYEDLVSQPKEIITQIFEKIPLSLETGVFKFYESNATVHGSKHPNAENLKKDFFTQSVGRWEGEICPDDLAIIEETCKKNMEKFNYEASC